MHNSDKVMEIILNHYVNNRFVLGIDGLSRSGKTTLVEELRQRLIQYQKPVCIFHIDDHIVERKKRYDTGFEQWYEYYNLQWDVEFLREHLFAKLHHAHEVILPFYNSALDELETRTVTIPTDCIVIVEGVFLQRQEWRGFFDFVVYLDCPRDKRFERESATARENVEKFELRYWKAEDFYLDSVRPFAIADMVLSS